MKATRFLVDHDETGLPIWAFNCNPDSSVFHSTLKSFLMVIMIVNYVLFDLECLNIFLESLPFVCCLCALLVLI